MEAAGFRFAAHDLGIVDELVEAAGIKSFSSANPDLITANDLGVYGLQNLELS